MKENAKLRKWCALLTAVIVYFIVHEGCHALVATCFGALERVRLLGLGVQVVVKQELLSDWQLGVFSIIGSIGTLLAAYLLLTLTKNIVQTNSKLIKAIGYYTTFTLLLVDPIYMTFLYKFVGGGDMNGIKLLWLPELGWQIIYGIIAIINVLLIARYVYPAYKKAFN